MTSRISLDRFLSLEETRALEPARAAVLQSLAGRTRVLAEMVTGQSIVDGEAPAAPINPQRIGPGIDFSGPPHGSAWMHMLATGGWRGDDDTSDVQAELGRWTLTSERPVSVSTRIYVRPHTVYEGAPYSRGALILQMKRGVGSDDPYGVKVTCSANDVEDSAAITVTLTTLTIRTPACFFALRPGINRLTFTLEALSSGTAYLYQWGVANTAKRRFTI